MRVWMLMATLLTGCNQPITRTENALPDDDTAMIGPIVAVGVDWQLSGDPWRNAVSIYMADGTETSGTWVSPYFVRGRISASDIRVELENTACEQDNIPYPMRATVSFPGHELTGCAAMRWDSRLSELIEQIDLCISAAPEQRKVTYAGEMADGSTLVRLGNGVTYQDCRVENGRAALKSREENFVVATESAAILLRARPGETEIPAGECPDAPEAMIYGHHFAKVVGWMIDPMGC